jgi:hypothetical protein
MSKINAFSHVLKQKVKARFFFNGFSIDHYIFFHFNSLHNIWLIEKKINCLSKSKIWVHIHIIGW